MIAVLPLSHASSLAATPNAGMPAHGLASNALDSQIPSQTSSQAPDVATQANDIINHHFNNGTHHHGTSLPDHVEAFYAMGPNAPVEGPPPVSNSPSMAMDSANVFDDLPRYLQQEGGATNPAAMLAAQMQITQATLGWTLIGQMASKAVSGMQTLFNNQV